MIDWDEIQKEFETTSISLVDLATKHNIKYPTIKSRKQRKKWQKRVNPKGASKNKKNASKAKQKTHPKDVVIYEFENVELTEKQQLFCQFFVHNRNATQAAIKAGYSVQTAGQIGYQLLQKPLVRKEINRLKKLRQESIMFDPDDILELKMRIAFSDMTDVADWGVELIPVVDAAGNMLIGEDGNVQKIKRCYLDFKNSNEVDGSLISEIKLGRQGMSVKLEDRQKAQDWLADYFNMNPMNKHKIAYNNAVLVMRERELKIKEF